MATIQDELEDCEADLEEAQDTLTMLRTEGDPDDGKNIAWLKRQIEDLEERIDELRAELRESEAVT